MKLNENYGNLAQSYLFSEIAHRVAAYKSANPDKKVISLGIGDVTQPICGAAITAMHEAVAEMGEQATFHGYGPEQGYGFAREAVCGCYARRGVSLDLSEVFISDGAKSDIGNILDLFDSDNIVAITDPVYPVYLDTNVMAGRRVTYLDATEANGFLPTPDGCDADIIYLCSPANPTGAAYDRAGLQAWVDHAVKRGAVILFDAAYEAFVTGDIPHSIYETDGARECAIEFSSLSKTAGFTGLRCGYTVVPNELCGGRLNKMWLRRQTTKFNGVSYVTQRAAAAALSPEGITQTRRSIDYYRKNAAVLADALESMGVWYTGGVHSPYVWLKCPGGCGSWEFFDRLLTEQAVVGTPGEGFGRNGRGFFRLTAFGDADETREAAQRLCSMKQRS